MDSTTISHNPEEPIRHTCHCGKSFLRKEHLRRHQATHNRPSFACHVCGRSFTRNDVLRRHIAVHESTQVSTARSWKACDACHENKTKCDGGAQCSLCTKRGIPCAYDRDPALKEAERTGNVGSRLTPSSGTDQDVSEVQMQVEPSVDSSFRVGSEASEPMTTSGAGGDDADLARTALRCVMDAVSNVVSGASVTPRKPQPPQYLQEWLPSRLKIYFGRFHERWPIAHAPVFDPKTDDALMVSTVLIIASWIRDPESARDAIVSIHDKMVSHLLKIMAEPVGDLDDSTPWPYETYAAALLNVIFAFETGRQKLIPRARRLLSILIATLREKCIFNPQAVDAHASKHQPGTFRPWVQIHRAKWQWLTLSLVKIDTYLAMICNQPALLRSEELESGLTTTFSVFNAYGIDKFFARDHQEPLDRAQRSMAELMRGPMSTVASGTLVEDTVLGFCGMYPSIWKQRRSQRTVAPHCLEPHELVAQRLGAWKARLEGISNLWTDPQSNIEAITYLVRAYRGEEETDQPDWESPVLNRIAVHTLNASFFYHLLGLHLNADIRAVTMMTLGTWSFGGPTAPKPDASMEHTLHQWSLSKESRSALWHALYILKTYEAALSTMDTPCSRAMDPIAHVALSTAAMVLRTWFMSCIADCQGHELPLPNIDIHVPSETDQWIEVGDTVAVDGVPLCPYSSGAWMGRFASGLERGGRLWETSASVIASLKIPLDWR